MSAEQRAPRVLIHVQHLRGIGHQRRAAAVARALTNAGAEVIYVSGGEPVSGVDVGRARFVQLPPARAASAAFEGLVDSAGRPVDEAWKTRRAARLMAVFEAECPDVVVTETYPFGRGLLRFELQPLVRACRERRPRPALVSSIRDILEARADPRRYQRMADAVLADYDRVLVHGDPDLVSFQASFPPYEAIADLCVHTGYVVEDEATNAPPEFDANAEVLVSAGGGVGAGPLLLAVARARPLSTLADCPWRIRVGPDVGAAARESLRAEAGEGLTVEDNQPDFVARLARCRVSVSRAGYNTVAEVLSARARAVLVPYQEAGQSEQVRRAQLLDARGVAVAVAPADAAPDALAAAIDRADRMRRPPPCGYRLDGARCSAAAILELTAPGRSRRPPA